MKKIMEMLQNMKNRNEKKDNKGFSLVELIIVIAIMAILVGIVGTQVLPYINKSKEAKDFQIINSYGTAATTAYASNAENVTAKTTVNVYAPAADAKGTPSTTLSNEIKKLTGYDTLKALTDKMGSSKGKEIAKIECEIDIDGKKITTQAYDKDDKAVFDAVVTEL